MQDTMTRDIANVDFSTIAALQQKRTLAFVNHFILTTVQFLNNFSKRCEQKLMHFERKLEKVEAAMVLLEARLSSIPEVNTISEAVKPEEIKAESIAEVNSNQTVQTNITVIKEESEKVEAEETFDNGQVQAHPEYDKFLKMVQVGVPLQAVKLKVSTEGLDPNILDQILNKM